MTTLRSLFIITAICISCLLSACSKDDLRSTVDPTLPSTPDPEPAPVVDTSAPSFRQMLGTYKGTWHRYSSDSHHTPQYNYDETSESILEIKRVNGDTLKLVVDGVERNQIIYNNLRSYKYPSIDQLYLTVTFGGDSVLYEYKNSEESGSISWYHNWGEVGKWKKIKKGL